MKNIVLIGMPSCGKSTIGEILATKLNKTFLIYIEDLLDFMKSEERASIPISYFEKKG